MKRLLEIIKKRYHMVVPTAELRRIKKGESEEPLEFQYSAIAMSTTLLCAIAACIVRTIAQPSGTFTKVLWAIPVFVLLIFFVVGVITEERDGVKSRFVLAISLILLIPVIWIMTGGIAGMGPVWFVLCTAFLSITLSPKYASILLPFHCVTTLITIWHTLRHPDIVIKEDAFQTRVGIISSIIIISYFVYTVITTQKRIAQVQRDKTAALQEEITAANEELTAQNEELIAMNVEITEMAEKLQHAMETQRIFTASMTHELRSPLNGIEGCLQMMLMSGTLDKENTISVQNALNASHNLIRNINDMLDFTKLQEGKFEIIEEDFDLRTIIDTLSYLFESQIKEKCLEYNVHAADDMVCTLVGDGGRIQQIMTNLISNSVKYTPAGSIDFSLDVDTDKKILQFSVKDTGMGMSEESLETIFDPFTRYDLKKNAKIQGTGLGMSIVSNLIKAMGGEINVESELGKGTKFTVCVPVGISEEVHTFSEELGKEEEKKHKQFSEAVFPGKNILCVDDTKLNLIIFKGLLKKSEVNIDLAYSGHEALDMVKEKKYDLIFMDHLMPEMDGIETYEKIKSTDNLNASTPVVMLSGNTSSEHKALYAKAGFACSIEKPVEQSVLIEVMEKYL